MNYTFLVFLFNPILTNYVNQSLNSENPCIPGPSAMEHPSQIISLFTCADHHLFSSIFLSQQISIGQNQSEKNQSTNGPNLGFLPWSTVPPLFLSPPSAVMIEHERPRVTGIRLNEALAHFP
jgi:hypothetical protein